MIAMASSRFAIVRLYTIPLIVAILDQATKLIMLELIFTPPRIIAILPFLNLTPVFNKGVSFGLFGNAGAWTPIILTGFALFVGFVLPYVARDWHRLSRLGAMLMAGGGFGNAIDRIIHAKVVDFIDFFIGRWHWPAFNLADIAIVGGGGLIVLELLIRQSSRSKS